MHININMYVIDRMNEEGTGQLRGLLEGFIKIKPNKSNANGYAMCGERRIEPCQYYVYSVALNLVYFYLYAYLYIYF